jgi:chromosome segregation ATPase
MVSQADKIKNLEAQRDAALHGHEKDLQMLSQLQDHNSQLQDHNSKTKTAAFAAEQRAEAVLEGVRAQSDDLAQKLRDMQLERENTFGQCQQFLEQQQEMRNQIEDLKDQLKVALDGKAKAELCTDLKKQELDHLLGRLQARLRDLEDLEYVKGELAGLRDRLAESDKNRQYEADEKDRQAKEAQLLRGQLGNVAMTSCVRM